MFTRILVAVFAILLSHQTFAVDLSGNYAVWGIGKKSCFAYLQSDTQQHDRFRDYMRGYLTAYNTFTEDTYSLTGRMTDTEIDEWLLNYCEDTPMASYESALISFIEQQYPKRMKSARSVGRGT